MLEAMHQYDQSDLLDELAGIFPDFASYWQAEIADGAFLSSSLHSVYMSFLPFLTNAHPTPKQWKRLADHFSEAVEAGGDRENAASTCFFEGLRRGGAISQALRPLLSKKARSCV